MPLWSLAAVQWLHIASGITWIGSAVALDAVVWPVLLRTPASQARALYESVLRVITPLAGVAGAATILLGILRGTVFGPITSGGALLGTAYGVTWLVALGLSILVVAEGAVWHPRVHRMVWEADAVRPGAARKVYSQSAFELGCFAIIVVCMVLLGLGL
jgi:uncharacterized membrane protein